MKYLVLKNIDSKKIIIGDETTEYSAKQYNSPSYYIEWDHPTVPVVDPIVDPGKQEFNPTDEQMLDYHIRPKRDILMSEAQKRINRYDRETESIKEGDEGITETTDPKATIKLVRKYMKDLAEVPQKIEDTQDPATVWAPNWPVAP